MCDYCEQQKEIDHAPYVACPDGIYFNSSLRNQYYRAYHVFEYIAGRNYNNTQLEAKIISLMCQNQGISQQAYYRIKAHYKLRPTGIDWQRQRAAIAQSKEQISAYDVMSASYPI